MTSTTMPVTIKIAAPLYNDESLAPPPFPCKLTVELEFFNSKMPPSIRFLLANEVLPATPTGAGAQPSKDPNPLRPSRAPEFVLARTRSGSPYHPRPSPKSDHSTPEHRDSFDPSASDTESTYSASEELSEDSKIPKPQGEPGRPGRGGYTLEIALGWNPKEFSKFKKSVHALVDEHLDVTRCASAQNPELLKLVRNKALDKFPDLENYSNYWPVNDLIMMRLKYTSCRARRRELEMAAGKRMKTVDDHIGNYS